MDGVSTRRAQDSLRRVLSIRSWRWTSRSPVLTGGLLQRVTEDILNVQSLDKYQRSRSQGGGKRQAQAAGEHRHQHLRGDGERGREGHGPFFHEWGEHVALKTLHAKVEPQDRQRTRWALGQGQHKGRDKGQKGANIWHEFRQGRDKP